MTTLINRIRADQLEARKAKLNDTLVPLLTTLLGEATMVGKTAGNRETTDEEVTAVIRKFIKNANETLKVVDAESEGGIRARYEIKQLEAYLPQQMTEDQLRERVTHYFTARSGPAPTKGELMGYLKLFHAGTYDGKMAAQVVDQVMKSTA